MVGQKVGNYRIVKLLGEGGMGRVYLGEHPGIGRKVGIKVLRPQAVENRVTVQRFFNEARAATAIAHPGIVEIFDFGALPDGSSYIAMEFLDGESLAARLKRTRQIPVRDAVEFAAQIASALGAAHARGIVHRDLKPDNIFLVADPQAPEQEVTKVLDFGIAKLTGDTWEEGGTPRTRTGMTLGTPTYMSPEHCRGSRETDHRTDIYALGIILYEMLRGAPPFVSDAFGELAFLHISVPPPPLRPHNPFVTEKLERIVMQALAKEPSARFQTAGEFQQALQSLRADLLAEPQSDTLAESGTPVHTTGKSPGTTFSDTATSLGRRTDLAARRPWILPAIAGTVALLGALAIWGMPAKMRPSSATANRPLPGPQKMIGPAMVNIPSTPTDRIVHIHVDSEPAGARILRADDRVVVGATPFDESRSAASGILTLRLEREGYQPEILAVPLDHDLKIAIPLRKAPAAAKSPASVAPLRARPGASSKSGKAHNRFRKPEPVEL